MHFCVGFFVTDSLANSLDSWILCQIDSSVSSVKRSLGKFHQYISPGISCVWWELCKFIIATFV